jgi:hypothetical protein
MGAALLSQPDRAGIDVVVAKSGKTLKKRAVIERVVNLSLFCLIDREFGWPIFRQ